MLHFFFFNNNVDKNVFYNFLTFNILKLAELLDARFGFPDLQCSQIDVLALGEFRLLYCIHL